MRVLKVAKAKKLHIFTWGHVVEGVVPGLEHEMTRVGQTTLGCW